ncbi:MAG TPA: transporter substrate-binding domain-containing protein [Candidatus Dormibacteraeota bacterium]|nr:transporter substrate-binding domain-containing protein [Candidatus Dormibacteraeota bacterium]
MKAKRYAAPFFVGLLLLAACQTGGSPSAGESAAESAASSAGAGLVCDGEVDGYLARICEAGKIVAFTDPAYPPASSINEETGEYEGFDIDVTNYIAARLGVEVEYTTPAFDAVVAGDWAERWDIAVGSVTVTEDRKEILDFTVPYYFTPAQMATFEESTIQSIDDFAGTTVCVGEATTYLDWMEGSLTLPPEAGEVAAVPDGVVSTTLPTDIDCADSWASGRTDFEGWISGLPIVEGAIADDYAIRKVGDPIFYEPLAVCFDKSVEDRESLVAAVNQIVQDMHDDGTLTTMSETWFDGIDLTKQQ